MPVPQEFLDFDIANSTVQVWLFKKSYRPDGSINFSGHWIDTDDLLDNALKQAIIENRNNIHEVNPYSLLASASDGIALQIDALETNAGILVAAAANPVPGRKTTNLKTIQNSVFYLVKLVCDEHALYVVRKTDNSWKSKKTFNLLSVFFADEQLGLNESPGFTISKNIDFFIFSEDIFIINKPSFESILNYKTAHSQDFLALQSEREFVSLFEGVDHLVGFINTNKLQLRRACAIRQKGHYRDPNFIHNLRQRYQQCGLNINFNDAGQIVVTPDTCADIVRALLDHRLSSLFSENNYDVPDATIVS